MGMNFFEGASANADSEALPWSGGMGTFFAAISGTGTVKLQASFDGQTWSDVAEASFTSTGHINFILGACRLRANIADASGLTATAGVRPIR